VVTREWADRLKKYYGLDGDLGPNTIAEIWRLRFNYVSLLALKDFFQPETRIICGKVFLRSPGHTYQSEEEFLTARQSLDYKAQNIDGLISSFNWVELDYQLGPVNSVVVDFPDSELLEFEEEVAKVIRVSWDVWLHATYTDRKFLVRTLSPEVTGYSWGVGFEEILS
jgi:hypothetical protein